MNAYCDNCHAEASRLKQSPRCSRMNEGREVSKALVIYDFIDDRKDYGFCPIRAKESHFIILNRGMALYYFKQGDDNLIFIFSNDFFWFLCGKEFLKWG